jgi:hypothetical protein
MVSKKLETRCSLKNIWVMGEDGEKNPHIIDNPTGIRLVKANILATDDDDDNNNNTFSQMILTVYSNVKLFLSTPCRR